MHHPIFHRNYEMHTYTFYLPKKEPINFSLSEPENKIAFTPIKANSQNISPGAQKAKLLCSIIEETSSIL